MLLRAPREVRASSRGEREQGRVLFREKGCEHCHGVDGAGGDRGPSLAAVGRKWKPEQIRRQIEAGGGGMPAFGDVLGPDEVSRLVEYLKTKRSRVKPPPPAKPHTPSPAGSGGSDDQS